MSDKDDLTIKQQKFVEEVAQGKPASHAVIEAGYKASTPQSAASMGHKLMTNPKVQGALSRRMAEMYPDADRDLVNLLRDIVTNPMERTGDRMKAAEMLIKVKGWYAPTKSASVNVAVKDKWKLPEE
jgi:phage terminase small subunit